MAIKTQSLPTFFAGVVIGLGLTIAGVAGAKLTEAKKEALPLNELRAFTDVFARIKNDYVEKVDDKKLIQNAIRGMLAGLDPHSSYLDPTEFKELQVGTSGEFGGLGIEVTMENGFVKVVAPIDDTPAQKAGVKPGDIIIRLDDTPVKGLSLNDAVKKMRGKPGTDVTLTVVRDGADKPFKIVITRSVIKTRSVRAMSLQKGYGYLRITQFQSKTGKTVVDKIKDLMKKSDGKLHGLVIDLRNNPGGVLNASVEVSDAFLEKGKIVFTRGRVPDSKLEFSATEGDIINGAPIVVLVNGGSASASEIVAGALQDHKRAIIMGEKTFGKGSVQTILPSRGGTAVKLTTARYYTPNGRSIQAEGIEPDITVENLKFDRKKIAGVSRLKEKDLSRHLMSAAEKKKQKIKKAANKKLTRAQKMLNNDYQLYEALNLLKGLHIARVTKSKISVVKKPGVEKKAGEKIKLIVPKESKEKK